MSNAERVMTELTSTFAGNAGYADKAEIARMAAAIGRLAEEDFASEMIGVGGFNQNVTGAKGLTGALADWTEMFSEMRFEAEDVEDVGENVVLFARQIGVTRHGAVEIEQASAVVFRFRDGRIFKTEWHLDRDAARRSAQSTQE